ncbi:MAG: hypothetical protein NC200_06035 [Candidatus Gastranaerophilales bacterium]|nr:hypothetical protein [Candidatus Gastranaerophilales bacterium]
MNLFFNKLLSGIPTFTATMPSRQERSYSTALLGPDKDTFQKTPSAESISFTGSKSSKTKAGDCLKELDNITCPYSGVKMISGSKMDKLEKKLEQCDGISERMELLGQYRPCMQKLEKKMYEIFKGYEINNPNGSLNDCLQQMKPECLAELKVDQIKVLDDIDKISNKMDAKTSLNIRRITTNARKIILDDNQDQIFKRKDLLTDLYRITSTYPDEELSSQMWQTASRLPKSTTNINAFVVKYANRSPHEIAARLLRPSVASIEHISPKSTFKTGKNKEDHTLSNFMLVSRDWNSDRSSIPLPEYIKAHSQIPKYSQRYANDIIAAIHKGKLVDCDWYPYVLKEKLYNESQGMINLDLSKYKISKEDALKTASSEILGRYEDCVEANKKIPPVEP